MGFFSFVFGSMGCFKQSNMVEDKIKFSTYTQQERKSYIKNYFLEKYGISCMVSDVKQKQITAIKNEDYYFATVTTFDNDLISIWITKDGKITDTIFLLEESERLLEHFSVIIKDKLPDCKVKIHTEMRDIPTLKLTETTEISDYLYEQPVFTYIRIFVDNNVNEEILDELQNIFNYCDAALYLYICEDIDDVDVNTYDFTSFKYLRNIKKDK